MSQKGKSVLLQRSCKILVIIKAKRCFLSGVTAKPLVLRLHRI